MSKAGFKEFIEKWPIENLACKGLSVWTTSSDIFFSDVHMDFVLVN